MSARLCVELDPNPIERVPADLAIVPVFTADRPLRGAAGRADWRLCGELSRFAEARKLTGALGEAALVESGGRLSARFLLALGAGPRAELGPASYRAFSEEASSRITALGAGRVALAPPSADASALPARVRAETLLAALGEELEIRRCELELRIVLPPDERAAMAEALHQAAPRALPASITLELPARSDRGSSEPRRAQAGNRPFVSHRY